MKAPLKSMTRHNAVVPDINKIETPTLLRATADPLVAVIVVHPVAKSELAAVCKQWDEFFEEFDDTMLGRAYMAVGFGPPETSMPTLPGARKNSLLNFSVQGNAGARDGWGWRNDRTYYAFEQVDSNLLLKEMPLIEMRSFRAELLRKYYRDQRLVIASEAEQQGKDLSKILYSTLVPSNNQEQLARMEEDLVGLSRGYGLLTSNHRIIKEGHNRLVELERALNS
ncbi:MAG: hypothetical protein ACM3QW_06275, partial [Ignavibacteriales bacterium]